MPLQYLDWADDAALSVIYWLAGLVSIAVLLDEGLRHILEPATSKLAGWLEVLNLSVAAGPELSLAGILAVLVMLVGVAITLTVLVAAYQIVTKSLDM